MSEPAQPQSASETPAHNATGASAAGRGHVPGSRWAAFAFPLILWALATCYLGGDLGKWMDDYHYSARDFVTGDYTFEDILTRAERLGPFYRPAGQLLVVCQATVLWDHDWITHLLTAVTHGLVTLLVWQLLRRLTSVPLVAAAGAIAFLVYPLSYEVMLFPAAQVNHFATAAGVLLVLVYRRYAVGRGGWKSVVLMTLLAYAITLWQEQPATVIIALPLLYLAVCRPGHWRRRVLRALVPVLTCGLACVVYLLLVAATVPEEGRGAPANYTPIGEVWERISVVAVSVADRIYGPGLREALAGAFGEGWGVLAGLRGFTWLVILGIAAGVWWRTWCVRPLAESHTAPPPSLRGRLLLIMFGLGWFAVAWIPVAALKSQIVETRMLYHPLIGLLLAAAVLLDWLAAGLARFRPTAVLYKGIVCTGVVWATTCGALCLVGYQELFRSASRLDGLMMTQLRELVPDPAAFSVFVPLRTENWAGHTGYPAFDRAVFGALMSPRCANHIIRQTYRRPDVGATAFNPWAPPPLRDFDEWTAERVGANLTAEDRRARLIPFVVDAGSRVHLVSTLHLDRGGPADERVSFPQAQAALGRHGLPERVFVVQDDRGLMAPLELLRVWRWATTGQPVSFAPSYEWQASNISVEMHPPYAGDPDRGALVTTLAASSQPARLRFRVTFAEWTIKDRAWGDGVELVWHLDGEEQTPLARQLLLPADVAAQERWLPVIVELPALPQPRQLYIKAGPGPAGNVDYDACLVTHGYREFSMPSSGAP